MLRRAFSVAASASASEIVASLADKAWPSLERLVLRGVLARLEGRSNEAISLLMRARRMASPDQAAYVADILVPLLVTRNDLAEAESVLEGIEPDDDILAGLQGLHALVAAASGEEERCDLSMGAARSALDNTTPLIAARTLQRLAGAAYYRRMCEQAIEDATASAGRFIGLGVFRSAAASFSVAYIVHHTITGDVEQAYGFAHLARLNAQRSGDVSFVIASAAAEYEIAAEVCDQPAYDQLKAYIRSHPVPTQCRERFARGIADCLPFAWRGDFAAFRANVLLLTDAVAETPSQRALCIALWALADAALDNRMGASQASRRAIGLASIKGRAAGPAFEERYRRLARALAGAACLIIGDTVRGRRVLSGRSFVDHADLIAMLGTAEGSPWEKVPRAVRGYARVVASAREQARSSLSPLTDKEVEVLRWLADGLSAPQIARSTRRSVHTVRAHTRAIIQKLNVHGRAAAVAEARRCGLLQ